MYSLFLHVDSEVSDFFVLNKTFYYQKVLVPVVCVEVLWPSQPNGVMSSAVNWSQLFKALLA